MNIEEVSKKLDELTLLVSEVVARLGEVSNDINKERMADSNAVLRYDVSVLDLQPRVSKAFAYYKIKTLQDLLNVRRNRILMMRGVGPGALKGLERNLKDYGLKLKD